MRAQQVLRELEQLVLDRDYCEHRGDLRPLLYGPRLAVAVDECGNTPVRLKVLSYAGMLTIAVIIDRDHGLDLDKLSSGCRTSLS